MIPVFHATYPVAMKKSIKGFVQTPLGNYRFENLVKEQ
jgi:ABC-type transport system substrate-binding protein